MRLSHADFDMLQEAILEIHECRDCEELLCALPAVLARLVPAEFALVADASPKPETGTIAIDRHWASVGFTYGDFMQRVELYMPVHPFTTHMLTTGDLSALRQSDFLSFQQLCRTGFYSEVQKPLGVRYLLSTLCPGARENTLLSIARRASERDFSERDRTLVNALRPHLMRARERLATRRVGRDGQAPTLEELGLTAREIGVAVWLAAGKTNTEIARILDISARTVEKHVERVLDKLRVENRTAAALIVRDSRRR